MLAHGLPLPTSSWLTPPIVPPLELKGSTRRLARLARAQLRADSVWFRNGVRVGVGLGLAVLIVALASLSHAFWVALAVLSVLKSNAVGLVTQRCKPSSEPLPALYLPAPSPKSSGRARRCSG